MCVVSRLTMRLRNNQSGCLPPLKLYVCGFALDDELMEQSIRVPPLPNDIKKTAPSQSVRA